MKKVCGCIVVDFVPWCRPLVKGEVKMLCFWIAVCVTVLLYFSQSANGVSQTFSLLSYRLLALFSLPNFESKALMFGINI
jgi:hypothetical protein